MEHAAHVIHDFSIVLNAHYQHALHAPLGTFYRLAHVQIALSSTQTVPLVIPSTVFHAKTVTFWRITLAITALQSDSQDATHAIPSDASHAIRVSTLTLSLVPVPPVTPSFPSAWSATSTVAHLAQVGTLSRLEIAALATRSSSTVSHALHKNARHASQVF